MSWLAWYTFLSQPRAVFLFLRGELSMTQEIMDTSPRRSFEARKVEALKWLRMEDIRMREQSLRVHKKDGEPVHPQHNIDGNGMSTTILTPPEIPKKQDDLKDWKRSPVDDVPTGQDNSRPGIL